MAKEAFPVHNSANMNNQEGMALRDYVLTKLTASWTIALNKYDSIMVTDIGEEALRLATIQTAMVMEEMGYEG